MSKEDVQLCFPTNDSGIVSVVFFLITPAGWVGTSSELEAV